MSVIPFNVVASGLKVKGFRNFTRKNRHPMNEAMSVISVFQVKFVLE